MRKALAPYRKSILAAIVALTTAIAAALTDGGFTATEVTGVLLAVFTALGVYQVPNAPLPPA